MSSLDCTRKEFIRTVGVGAAAFAMSGCKSDALYNPRASTKKKPNFIIILADDLGYRDTSCYDGWIRTPHIDHMAAEGMRFTDYYANSTVCAPTRAAMMTGRYQQRSGVIGVGKPFRGRGFEATEITMPQLLKEAGYATGLIGKWNVGGPPHPFECGFDYYLGYSGGCTDHSFRFRTLRDPKDGPRPSDWRLGHEPFEEEGYGANIITKHSIKFIEKHKDEPFFLMVSQQAVHWPWQAPGDPAFDRNAWNGDRFDQAEFKKKYTAMVTELDNCVGDIAQSLKNCGIDNDTFVFFVSDNGGVEAELAPEINGELSGHKGLLGEGGIRVPAIARWPGKIKAGVETNEIAITHDLMPTFLELAGGKVPASHVLDGISLLPLLLRGESLGPRQLFWWGLFDDYAMRESRWKCTIGKRDNNYIPRLYDLESDISEENDLAAKYPERTKRMADAIAAFKKEMLGETAAAPVG